VARIGILLHVYNVEDPQWEYLAWGDPAQDRLGSLPLLCRLLLTQPARYRNARIVIHNGLSQKDGLKEGTYSKRFLLDNLESLADFPRFKPLLESNPEKLHALKRQIEGIIIGADLVRTSDEISAAARTLRPPAIQEVIQIACASHAPRCLQLQAAARAQGQIPDNQLWLVMASDVFFSRSGSATDTVIFEEPHLGFDPMIEFRPTAPAVLRQYFKLPPPAKQQFLRDAHQFMQDQAPQE
jgi:hypothetical protein